MLCELLTIICNAYLFSAVFGDLVENPPIVTIGKM